MIGMIEPLVKEARGRRQVLRALLVYGAGAIASAAAMGALWGAVAFVVQRLTWGRPSIASVAVACAVLALVDLGVAGARPFGLARQTCSLWWRRLGPVPAWFCWGMDLGLGFSTYRATSLYWAAVLTVVLLAPPVAAPLAMAAYGLGLVANLAIAVLALGARGLFSERSGPSMLYVRPARIVSAALLASWASVALWLALT